MAIVHLAHDFSALGEWWVDYDNVALNVGHTCVSTGGSKLVLTIIRVATFQGPWVAGITYKQGDDVTGSNGQNYISLVGGNRNHDPVSDGGVNWASTTKDVSADFGQGRVVDISNVPNSEVPPFVKGQPYPFLFEGAWSH